MGLAERKAPRFQRRLGRVANALFCCVRPSPVAHRMTHISLRVQWYQQKIDDLLPLASEPAAAAISGYGVHMSARRAFVFQAELELGEGTDPRAPGAAVTVALCGSWDHEDPCRWPHHSTIDDSERPARLRTVFAVVPDEEQEVRDRMVAALQSDARWTVTGVSYVPATDDEAELGRRLSSAHPSA
jgi:hypothetical protein